MERREGEENACGSRKHIRYALNHKYPNEMWVYAPAGRGHTTHMVGVLAADRGSFCSVDVQKSILRRALCLGPVDPSWEVICAGEGGGNYPSCRRKDFTSALKPSRRSAHPTKHLVRTCPKMKEIKGAYRSTL
jgi:hypothetical protein